MYWHNRFSRRKGRALKLVGITYRAYKKLTRANVKIVVCEGSCNLKSGDNDDGHGRLD